MMSFVNYLSIVAKFRDMITSKKVAQGLILSVLVLCYPIAIALFLKTNRSKLNSSEFRSKFQNFYTEVVVVNREP